MYYQICSSYCLSSLHLQIFSISRLEKMEISSNVIKKCWQDILYERTLKRAAVVHQNHFSSLMSPFTTFGGGPPEPGSVLLKWLNLVADDDRTEPGKTFMDYTNFFTRKRFHNWTCTPF